MVLDKLFRIMKELLQVRMKNRPDALWLKTLELLFGTQE